MHIPDRILSPPVVAATTALAAAAVAAGLRKIDYERVPRVGVLASVFFVASLIRVPVPPSSVHLLLGGLTGLLLGWAAFPALAAALLLQAVLFGFGGLTSLGANVIIMGVPAVACYHLFARHVRGDAKPRRVFASAFAAGSLSVALACVLTGAVLFATGRELVGIIVAVSIGHVPVMVVEGLVTGSAVAFLHKVRPELLESPVVGGSRKETPLE